MTNAGRSDGPRVVAVVQARMTSSRLPGKVLLPLAGRPLLAHVLERAARAPGVDAVCLAAPTGAAHDPLEELAAKSGAACYRGSERDVLRRVRGAADAQDADLVVRVTADCPLLDPEVVGAVLALARATGAPLAMTALASGYPVGYDVEVMRGAALRLADERARDAYEREHVTPYLWRRPERFPCVTLDRAPDLRAWRLAVDTEEDYRLVSRIFEALTPTDPLFGFPAVEALLRARPEWLALNAGVRQTPVKWEPAAP